MRVPLPSLWSWHHSTYGDGRWHIACGGVGQVIELAVAQGVVVDFELVDAAPQAGCPIDRSVADEGGHRIVGESQARNSDAARQAGPVHVDADVGRVVDARYVRPVVEGVGSEVPGRSCEPVLAVKRELHHAVHLHVQ
jgi:hypothetical protein